MSEAYYYVDRTHFIPLIETDKPDDDKPDDQKPNAEKGNLGKQRAKKLSGRAAQQLSDKALYALPEIQAKLSEARTQLRAYQAALETHYGERLRLRTYAVVALGFERLVWEAV